MNREKNFEYAAVSELGCEVFVKEELSKRFSVEGEAHLGYVTFECSKEKASEIMYMSQSSKRILIIIAKGEFSDLEDLGKKMNDADLEFIKTNTFKINCERHGEHDFNSVMAEQETGRVLEEKGAAEVELKNPQIYLYLGINQNSFVIGVDLAGRDLSKRQYRVFNHPSSIKGTIAFSAIMYSGYKPGMTLVDAFALSGTIPIEAAIYESCKSVNYYDKQFTVNKIFENVNKTLETADKKILKSPSKETVCSFDSSFNNVSAQKKNAKIAGVEKFIKFSRTEGKDTDLKFDKNKIDVIVTRIIEHSKHITENKAKKIQEEFFLNINKPLKKTGTIVIISRDPEKIFQDDKFVREKPIKVQQGQQTLYFLKFKKKQGE